RDPQRLAALPDPSGESVSARVGETAGSGEETLHRFGLHPPAHAEAQHACLRVGAEIAAAITACSVADRPDRPAQRFRHAVRLGERARHGVLELAQLGRALARRDVLADTVVALERAAIVEHRLARDADPDFPPRRAPPAELEI